jgi:NAD(P) transhydrogenase subunit alpha
VDHNGVIVYGPKNFTSTAATHASEMYSRNLYNLLQLLVKEGALELNWDDQVLADSCLTHDGEVKHGPTRERLEGGK